MSVSIRSRGRGYMVVQVRSEGSALPPRAVNGGASFPRILSERLCFLRARLTGEAEAAARTYRATGRSASSWGYPSFLDSEDTRMSLFVACLYSIFVVCNLVCLSMLVARGQFYRLFPASLWLSLDLLVTAFGIVIRFVPSYRFVYRYFMTMDTAVYVVCLLWMVGVAMGGDFLARIFLSGMAALGAAKWLETLMWNSGANRIVTEGLNAVLVLLVFAVLLSSLNTLGPLTSPNEPQELPASVWTGMPAPAAVSMRVPQ